MEFYSYFHQIQTSGGGGGGGLACSSNASASLHANAATRPPAAPQLDLRSSICNVCDGRNSGASIMWKCQKSVALRENLSLRRTACSSSISWGHFPKAIIRSTNLCSPTVSCCSARLLYEQQRDETQDIKTTSTPAPSCSLFRQHLFSFRFSSLLWQCVHVSPDSHLKGQSTSAGGVCSTVRSQRPLIVHQK